MKITTSELADYIYDKCGLGEYDTNISPQTIKEVIDEYIRK